MNKITDIKIEYSKKTGSFKIVTKIGILECQFTSDSEDGIDYNIVNKPEDYNEKLDDTDQDEIDNAITNKIKNL